MLRKLLLRYLSQKDQISIQAYFGLLLLAGVYRSHGEVLESLWDYIKGRPIFNGTMSLKHKRKTLTRQTSPKQKCMGANRQQIYKKISFPTKRRTNKWPQPLFYNVLNISASTLHSSSGKA